MNAAINEGDPETSVKFDRSINHGSPMVMQKMRGVLNFYHAFQSARKNKTRRRGARAGEEPRDRRGASGAIVAGENSRRSRQFTPPRRLVSKTHWADTVTSVAVALWAAKKYLVSQPRHASHSEAPTGVCNLSALSRRPSSLGHSTAIGSGHKWPRSASQRLGDRQDRRTSCWADCASGCSK